MSLKDAPMKRLRPAVAVFLASGLATTAAHAADRSLPQTVTGAFETVVIDATTAAAKATAAAKDALAPAARKTGGKTEKKKDAASDAKSDAKDDKAAGKTADAPKQAEDKDKKDGAKAADESKPDKATDKPGDAAKKKPPPIPTEWPAVDIELAKARCTQLLKGVEAVTLPEAPFRKGDCGSAAPVRLISIGKSPEVSLSPPPIVSCDMVVALTKWIKDDVQPLARRHLGAEVIKMESMSDYSCRLAYGRIGNKLSEHGKANALDIRGFMTSKGQTAVVLTGWGPNRRDIAREIAATKAAAEKAEAIKAAAEKAAAEHATAASASKDAPSAAIPRKTLVEGLPKDTASSGLRPAAASKETLGMAPTHLGGPKDTDTEAAAKPEAEKAKARDKSKGKDKAKKSKEPETVAALPGGVELPERKPLDATGKFLHAAHAAACKIFGTTLGPEANEAHRNHFHVDMAERKHRKICD